MSLYHAQGRLIWLITAAQSKLNPFSPIEVTGLEHTFKSLYCMINTHSMTVPYSIDSEYKKVKVEKQKKKRQKMYEGKIKINLKNFIFHLSVKGMREFRLYWKMEFVDTRTMLVIPASPATLFSCVSQRKT